MKNAFLRRSRRERLLILVFLGALAVVWLVGATGRLRERWREHRAVGADLAAQDLWLERRAAIEERSIRAASRLDPARTLDATRLVGEVSGIAKKLDLPISVDPPRTERTAQFAYHTAQVTFHRADLASLVKYYRELEQRAPYLAIETCTLTAGRTNPAEIDAIFAVFSVQVGP